MGAIANVIHVYNELLLLFVFITVLILNSVEASAENEELWGLVIIVAIILSLLFTWGIFLPRIMKGAYKTVSQVFKKEVRRETGKTDKVVMQDRVMTIRKGEKPNKADNSEAVRKNDSKSVTFGQIKGINGGSLRKKGVHL